MEGPSKTGSWTQHFGEDVLWWQKMRWLELHMRGLPSGAQFHLKQDKAPIRIEWPGGGVIETESRQVESPQVKLSMSKDQARALFEILSKIPGVVRPWLDEDEKIVLPGAANG